MLERSDLRGFLLNCHFLISALFSNGTFINPLTSMQFAIQHTWDSNPVDHDPITITFSPGPGGLKMQVFGPFFNDPAAPAGPPSQAFPGLWNYEVVESFFLDSTTENYLEVELCPHGQHLILLLSGVGQAFVQQLPMVFTSTISGRKWTGEALIPWSYFPPNVNKMNSYAIHGSGDKRTYEALYPVPKEDIVEGQTPNLPPPGEFPEFPPSKHYGRGLDPAAI